jgi:uncharacterized membrane protein YraQ (UPF0718 family)
MKREPLFHPESMAELLQVCRLVAKWTLIVAGLIFGGIVAVVVGTILPEQSSSADSERWAPYVAIYVAMWVVMARLERLGKQLEAVQSVIREEIATSAERKREIINEWRDNRDEEAKEARRFWLFWGIAGAMGLLTWFGTWLRHYGS